MRKYLMLAIGIAALAALFMTSCAPKVTTQVITKTMITAKQDTAINKTSDWKHLESIGAMTKGDTAEVIGVSGDYGKVLNPANPEISGFIWFGLTDKLVGGTVQVGQELTVTGPVGASLLAGPDKSYKSVGSVKTGDKVKVIEVAANWYQTPKGWVYGGHVAVSTVVTTNYITNK